MKVISVLIILLAAACVSAQKDGEAFPENATLDQTSKWLADNFAKNSSYKTSGRELDVSKVKFAACRLSYVSTTRFGSTDHAVMGATVRRSNSKRDVVIDLAHFNDADLTTADHLNPELRYIRLAKRGSTTRALEIIVKYETADAMRSALARAITLCKPAAG